MHSIFHRVQKALQIPLSTLAALLRGRNSAGPPKRAKMGVTPSTKTQNTSYFTSIRGDLLTHYHHNRCMRVKEGSGRSDANHRAGRVARPMPVYFQPVSNPERDSQLVAHVLAGLPELGWKDVKENDFAKFQFAYKATSTALYTS